MRLPDDYLERVYAGVLGKLIGVYLGRPFEGWTHQRIMAELGPIEYYVHERLNQPLVVTDDDVAGTFTFVRALEDYGVSPDLTAEDIGKAWLNYIVKERSILWWGGNGNSTEHTAWLNLHKGLPAPDSGSIATNGRTVAEQIGAQIFIDAWALVSPCRPELAARLAEQAGKVSHDGEAVHAAVLWAAMEAEAFRTRDIDRLLDVGLSFIPKDCGIARLAADVRRWRRENADWLKTRQLIEDHYGYDKYPGNCHVVPNHAIMLMAILYAPDDFQKSQMIINTSGWDTDCNAGNVGCLAGIMLGLDGLDAGPDWRGPLADHMLLSSADGGSSITDAVHTAHYLADLGRKLAGQEPLPRPKGGARFHFSLPGSVQGFRQRPDFAANPHTRVENAPHAGGRALAIDYQALGPGQHAAATTPTFSPPEVLNMRTYDLMATPLLYPGQMLSAKLVAPAGNHGALSACLRLLVYDRTDKLQALDSPGIPLGPGEEKTLEWRIPDLGGQPIAEVGVVLRAAGRRADGRVLVDSLGWSGAPEVTLSRPEGGGECDFWRMAWVNAADIFSKRFPPSFRISQDYGVGLVSHGTREWTDYTLKTAVTVHLGDYGGVAVRFQGLCRYYGIHLTRAGRLEIVRVRDGEKLVLAAADFPFAFEKEIPLAVRVAGAGIRAEAAGVTVEARDDSPGAFADGGIALLVREGALSADVVKVSPA